MNTLPFLLDLSPSTDVNSYFMLRAKNNKIVVHTKPRMLEPLIRDSIKLLYHINWLTSIYHLYIFLLLVLNIFAILYGEGHSGFA